MSLFNILLPAVSKELGSATSYVVTGAIEKVKEGTTKIAETVGLGSTFEKIGAALPKVSDLTSQAIRGGTSELTTNPFFEQQIAEAKRAVNGSVSAGNIKSSAGVEIDKDGHIIKLYDDNNYKVLFTVMPQVTESITVQYDAVAPVQAPGAFQKFKGSDATQWTINATFISRTSEEATTNLNNLNRLRGWSKPYFGNNTLKDYPNKIGAPPPVLTFEGFREKIIGPVPVVITALNWNWPNDVDYIPTKETDSSDGVSLIPFPAVLTIAITVVESFSTAQMNKFDLLSYRNGDMVGAYNTAT